MRIYLFIGLLFVTLVSIAQVANDDCSTAINLGYLNGWLYDSTDVPCFNGDGMADVYIGGKIDSNVYANYPYPQNPLPCEGYTSSIASPAKDLWYYISGVSCDLIMSFSCSDTTHISIWLGNNCSTIQPIRCFTLLPNAYITKTINGWGTGFYLQISSNSITNNTNFQACLKGSLAPCAPIWNYTDSTPVLCNNYHINVINESFQGANDGFANVSILDGNSPYTFQWSNGSSDSLISNLSAGWYYVTITDNNNCVESDSVEIGTITGIHRFKKNAKMEIYPNPIKTGNDFTIYSSASNINSEINIYNLTGELIFSQPVINRTKISTVNLGKGVFLVKVKNGNGIYAIEKLVIY